MHLALSMSLKSMYIVSSHNYDLAKLKMRITQNFISKFFKITLIISFSFRIRYLEFNLNNCGYLKLGVKLRKRKKDLLPFTGFMLNANCVLLCFVECNLKFNHRFGFNYNQLIFASLLKANGLAHAECVLTKWISKFFFGKKNFFI